MPGLKLSIFSLKPLQKSSIWDAWASEPDFQDLASALKPTIFLFNPLLKSAIWDDCVPEPDFKDFGQAFQT